LRDGGVRRYSTHVQQLISAQAQQVEQGLIKPCDAACYPGFDDRIEA
jgi:hypothetical protein